MHSAPGDPGLRWVSHKASKKAGVKARDAEQRALGQAFAAEGKQPLVLFARDGTVSQKETAHHEYLQYIQQSVRTKLKAERDVQKRAALVLRRATRNGGWLVYDQVKHVCNVARMLQHGAADGRFTKFALKDVWGASIESSESVAAKGKTTRFQPAAVRPSSAPPRLSLSERPDKVHLAVAIRDRLVADYVQRHKRAASLVSDAVRARARRHLLDALAPEGQAGLQGGALEVYNALVELQRLNFECVEHSCKIRAASDLHAAARFVGWLGTLLPKQEDSMAEGLQTYMAGKVSGLEALLETTGGMSNVFPEMGSRKGHEAPAWQVSEQQQHQECMETTRSLLTAAAAHAQALKVVSRVANMVKKAKTAEERGFAEKMLQHEASQVAAAKTALGKRQRAATETWAKLGSSDTFRNQSRAGMQQYLAHVHARYEGMWAACEIEAAERRRAVEAKRVSLIRKTLANNVGVKAIAKKLGSKKATKREVAVPGAEVKRLLLSKPQFRLKTLSAAQKRWQRTGKLRVGL